MEGKKSILGKSGSGLKGILPDFTVLKSAEGAFGGFKRSWPQGVIVYNKKKRCNGEGSSKDSEKVVERSAHKTHLPDVKSADRYKVKERSSKDSERSAYKPQLQDVSSAYRYKVKKRLRNDSERSAHKAQLQDVRNADECKVKKMLSKNSEEVASAHKHELLDEESADRCKVKETLRLFNEACENIIEESRGKPKVKGKVFRVDFEASRLLKLNGKALNVDKKIVGHVPGVKFGDTFQFRMELNILGIHRPSQSGIDYTKDHATNEIFAISVVASGGYDDDTGNPDVLVYTGQGGQEKVENQKLEKGNLALANSVGRKNHVRVIRGRKKTGTVFSRDALNYIYDGLYLVVEYWEETEANNKLVYKFKLQRVPKLSGKVVMKSAVSKSTRDIVCNDDISNGKERLPIRVVNEIDDEKLPSFFTYMSKMIYPISCQPIPPKSCNCIKSCMSCTCIAKNKGKIPYNEDGAIIFAKPLIYECGSQCQCPLSCYLRVTQRGIKFELEVFKTERSGWGVRSRNDIPIGSFVCEYVGELLEEEEAEKLVERDEYLFEISKEDNTSEFTIDAARKGNVGRLINHSCSPNLYVQNVVYDHEDKRMPHVMLFAQKNIPAFKELSYHYRYKIDQVRDANGNIRKKECYCGSPKCTGRLY